MMCWQAVRSKISLMVTMSLICLAATACFGSSSSSNSGGAGPTSTIPPLLKLVYDSNGCQQYEILGNPPSVHGVYCVTRVVGANVPTFDYSYEADLTRTAVFKQEFQPGNEAYAVRYWYSSKQWTRVLAQGVGDTEYCWRPTTDVNCEWVSATAYTQLNNQQVQNNQATQQQAQQARQSAAAAAEANRAEARRVEAEFEQRRIEMNKIWVRPACDSSFNGCL